MAKLINTIQDYYDQIASIYDTTRFSTSYGKYIHFLEKRLFLKWSKKYKFECDAFLDIGAGTGRWTCYSKAGVDVSFQMLKQAKQKNKSLYVTADGAMLPFNDNSFSGIICMHTLMHNEKKQIEKILNESKRVLKSGGWLLIDFPILKRKKLFSKSGRGWHAQTALNREFFSLNNGMNSIKLIDIAGYLLFPIHRVPKIFRPLFLPFEILFSKWPFREIASYNMALFRIQK